MLRFAIAVSFAAILTGSIEARPRKSNNYNRPVAQVFLGTAQSVANHLASLGRIGHFGGNPYSAEGVGMGASPEQAVRNCCFYGKRTIADSGVCQGSNGMWYACNRYH